MYIHRSEVINARPPVIGKVVAFVDQYFSHLNTDLVKRDSDSMSGVSLRFCIFFFYYQASKQHEILHFFFFF